VLRRPHLVLADFGGDDRIAVLGQLIQPLDRQLRHDRGLVGRVGQAVAGRQPSIRGLPLDPVWSLACGCPRPRSAVPAPAAIADDRQVDRTVLLIEERGRYRCGSWSNWAKGVEPPGDPVIEARADADHQVAWFIAMLAS
jgi:hypothetical protein